MLFFEISIFASDVFVSENRPKGHGIWLFLVMESHGIWTSKKSMNPVLDITYDLSSWTLHVTCFFLDIIWLVLLDIMYDLFSWTLCMTCYLGHYIMTCHLGHYERLAILDIIYDLSSWTLFRTRHLGHYIWLVILDILYGLSYWTLYMTCHIGHYFGLVILDIIYMTCHLGHYIWLVILDIVYILSSCTYDLQSMQIIWHVCKTIKDPSLIHKNICLLATHRTSLMCNNTFF